MPEIQLRVHDANRQVDATAGDCLVVALPESPSTGRSWFAQTSNAAVVRPEGETFDRSGPLIPGAAGTRRLRFLAATAGEATLSFSLAFAAAGTSPNGFSLHIVVR